MLASGFISSRLDRRLSQAALGLSLFLAATPGGATVLAPLSDEALLAQADLVVTGEVVEVDPTAGITRPMTRAGVEVGERIKGQAPALLRVNVPGGLLMGGLGLRIFGAPRLKSGQRVLLFLDREPDGDYGIVHLSLGAFHLLRDADGRQVAIRELTGARVQGAAEAAAASAAPRDAARFVAWLSARARGRRPPVDYLIATDDGGAAASLGAPFTLLSGDPLGTRVRWTAFDRGETVAWSVHVAGFDGQHSQPPAGTPALQLALAAWNDDPASNVALSFAGTTSTDHGFAGFDGVNTLLFGDPNNEAPGSYSCGGGGGGILAIGGGWFDPSRTVIHQGRPYYEIIGADIVTNDGTECLFGPEPTGLNHVLIHELGHALGLGHSCGDLDSGACGDPAEAEAMMRATLMKPYRSTLAADDRAGLRCLYGAGLTCAGDDRPPQPSDAPSQLVATPVLQSAMHLAWHDNSNDEYEFRIEARATGESAFREVQVTPRNATSADITGLQPLTEYIFRVRAGRANGLSPYSNEARATTLGPGCAPDATVLCLHGGRFRAEVEWRTASGAHGPGIVAQKTDLAGLFYFFAPANLEILLKTVNACREPFNAYWVFLSATTNVEFELTLTDMKSGQVKSYRNPLGRAARPVIDLTTFADCP